MPLHSDITIQIWLKKVFGFIVVLLLNIAYILRCGVTPIYAKIRERLTSKDSCTLSNWSSLASPCSPTYPKWGKLFSVGAFFFLFVCSNRWGAAKQIFFYFSFLPNQGTIGWKCVWRRILIFMRLCSHKICSQ